MYKIKFPESFSDLILQLKDNFSNPSFKHFEVLLSAILLGHPKKTITSGLRLMKPSGHFSNACRFLSQYKWDPIQLGLSVFKIILKYMPVASALTFALDDTLVAKFGSKIFGRGCHFDHARKVNRPKYINGHNWVVLGFLHFSFLFSKWLCFPILADLFVPEKQLDKNHQFRSRIQIAIDLIDKIKTFINKRFIVIADGLYAKKDLVKYCIKEKVTFISRLRSDAALFQKPKPVIVKKRGRPRTFGKRLPSLSQLASNKNDFKQYQLKLYGKQCCVKIKSFCAIWKPAATEIKVLIVYFDNMANPCYFFCTDLHLSDTKIVELIAARWSIETLFSDLKDHLGLCDWQCRIEQSVVRSVPLTCVATSILLLWSHQQSQKNQLEFWDVTPWYKNKASPSVYDMICQLKAKCISKTIFSVLPKWAIKGEKSQQIELFLKLAA